MTVLPRRRAGPGAGAIATVDHVLLIATVLGVVLAVLCSVRSAPLPPPQHPAAAAQHFP